MQICHLQTLTLQIYALHHLKGECTNTCYSVSWKLLLPLSEVVNCSSFPSPLTGVKLNQFASVWEKQNWLSTLYSTYDRLYKMEVEAKAGVWSSISSFTDLTILNLKNTRAGRRKLLTSICFIAGKSELSFGADLPGENMLPFSLRSHLSLPGSWTSFLPYSLQQPEFLISFYFFS